MESIINRDIMKRIKNFGIGTDIESIDRFRELDYVENKLFLNKIFTENELKYCFSKETAAHHLAVRYTGKEAIIKALSSMGKTLKFKQIEIHNDENGVPLVRINNFHNLQVYLSLSHCKDKAIAFTTVMEVDDYE